jgi:hypothetical protein
MREIAKRQKEGQEEKSGQDRQASQEPAVVQQL